MSFTDGWMIAFGLAVYLFLEILTRDY